jgi:hypothetical protein
MLMGVGLFYAVAIAASAYVFGAAIRPGMVAMPEAAWMAQAGAQLAGTMWFWLVFLYPNGWPKTRFGLRLPAAALAVTAMSQAMLALHPGDLFFWPGIENPFGIGPAMLDIGGSQAPAPSVLVAIVGPLVVAWVAWRYRRSRGVERLQLKWFASAVAVSSLLFAAVGIAGTLDQGAGPNPWPLAAFALAASLTPIAVGIAILRYRLYAIDHLIDRAIAYGIVTAILVGLFAVLVVALTAALEPITQGETVPVAAATIVVAALFQPVRRRVQRTIDRRFHRARYDAASTVDAFAERLRRTVDLGALEGELLAVVDGTVSPTASAVWVARGRGRAP